ncbi:MAG: carboxypeptidase regulatory-like domain-containing protein [Candidatus Cloacimonetes bacterium]|nr:carboxypeptidase regulatory-like domain-containing protein [Candidatus Cloacimonadota bacterium]
MLKKMVITNAIIFFLVGVALAQTMGGPDSFGYIWKNSNDPEGPSYEWIEPSNDNEVTGLTDDNSVGAFPIGFNFPFYEEVYDELFVSSNGFVSFGEGSSSLSNNSIPNPTIPNNIIAWFWDDLRANYDWANTHVFYENLTINEMDAFLITFLNYAEYGSTGTFPENCIQAQLILFSNGNIQINYDWIGASFDINGGTVGIENIDGSDGLMYCYNDGSNLSDELSILFYRPIPVDNDLMAVGITGPAETAVGVLTEFEISVRNRGVLTQNSFNINLYTEDGTLLTTQEIDDSLEPNETSTYQITYTPIPDNAGTFIIYGNVDLATDENDINNNTSTLSVYVNAEFDMSALSLNGPTGTSVGILTPYEVEVKNHGQTVSNYSVNLFKSDGTLLATTNINSQLLTGETAYHALSFTPDQQGEVIIFGNVELNGDGIVENNNTPNMIVTIYPEGVGMIQIGNGTTTANTLPIDYFYYNSLSQTMYYPEEFAPLSGGSINSIVYQYNFTEIPEYPNIQVWLAETDVQDFSNGWIPVDREEFTLVYDGAPEYTLGAGELVIPIDEPYFYSGTSNLIIMVRRADPSQYYNSTNQFYYEETPNYPNRAVEAHSDGTANAPDIYNPPTNYNNLSRVPNTTFIMDFTGTGSIEGICTSGGLPMDNVTVTAEQTRYSTTTDANGQYSFPFLITGTYNLTASKFGYYDETIQNITLSEGETIIVDFDLLPLENVTVVGNIQESDTGNNAVGATVNLTGYENYMDNITDENGNFSIDNVYSGHTYTLTIIYEGYEVTSVQAYVGSENPTDLGTVLVQEITNPPYGVVATQDENETVASLIWHSPSNVIESFFDFEENDGDFIPNGMWQWGTDNNSAYSGSNVWATTLSANYENSCNITLDSPEIRIGINSVLSFYHWRNIETNWDGGNIKISVDGGQNWEILIPEGEYNGTANTSNAAIPGEPCYTGTFEEWQLAVFDLSTYENTDAIFRWHFGSDGSVARPGWLIDDVRIGGAEDIRDSNSSRISAAISQRNNERIMEGYSIYRLLYGNEDDESSWTEISTLTDTVYTDNSWVDVEAGIHRYAVKSTYTGNITSQPAFSNWLPKDIFANSVTFNLTSNIGDIPSDVTIVMSGTNTDPDGNSYNYIVNTDEMGVAVIENVWKMTYDVNISGGTFDDYSGEVTVSNDDEIFNIELEESLLPPLNVSAVANIEDTVAEISWIAPGSALPRQFRHDDGVITSQIGATGSPDVLIGSSYAHRATLYEASWYLTNATSPHNEAKIIVFGLDAAGIPDVNQLIYESPLIANIDNTWNIHIFPEPLFCNNGFFVGINTPNVYTGLGLDDGVGEPYVFTPNTHFAILDWQAGNDWLPLETVGYPNNAAVRAFGLDFGAINFREEAVATNFEIPKGVRFTSEPLPENRNREKHRRTEFIPRFTSEPAFSAPNIARITDIFREREVLSYQIYRFPMGMEENEDQWTLLENEYTDVTYNDAGWSDLNSGRYRWGIKANYTYGVSESAISNILNKNMEFEVTLNLSTNSDDSPVGSTVTLTNNNEPQYQYSTTATSPTVLFPNVWLGEYTLTVRLAGFDFYSSINTINDDIVMDIELTETLLPVVALQGEYSNGHVQLSWLPPGTATGFSVDFEDGTLPEGWTTTTNSAVGWFITEDGSSASWPIPPTDGYYACSNDDTANDDSSVDYLISPSIDLSYIQAIDLSFSSFYTGIYSQLAHIEISEDNGNSWIPVLDLQTATNWTNVTVPLNGFCGPGHDNVRIGFHSDDNGGWGSGWAIDNILLGDGGRNRELIGANIYRGNTLLTTTPVQGTEWTDPDNLPYGTYQYTVKAVYTTGESPATIVEVDVPVGINNNEEIPAVTALNGNYPNPFNPLTEIHFGLKTDGLVKIDIYNMKGQKVKSLINEDMKTGFHHVTWFGNDDSGKKVSSGIYFYKMTSGNYTSTKKMIMLK